MMENLLEKLQQADVVCKEANRHFAAGAAAVEEAQLALEKFGTPKKRLLRIAGYAFGAAIGADGLAIMFLSWLPQFLQVLPGWCAAGFVVWQQLKKYRVLQENLAAARKLQAQEQAAGEDIFARNLEKVRFLPADYWYPMATEYLIKVVAAHRADSLKEALNLFDAQLHRWRVEEANNAILAQQQLQTAHLASIRTSSKISAAANVTNTLLNFANSL